MTKNSIVMAMATMVIAGCGNNVASTNNAPFSAGEGDNALDGAVISYGGSTYTLTASDTIEEIAISGGSSITFAKSSYEDLGFPLPVGIVANGDSVSIDLETGILSASVSVPFMGRQTFDFPVDLGALLTNRTAMKASEECEAAVSSADAFCELILDNSDMVADEAVSMATQSAEAYGVPEFAFGMIEDVIRKFLSVPVSFCDAWFASVPRGVCD